MISVIVTPGGLHMVLNGKQIDVAKSDQAYAQVQEALRNKAEADEIIEILEATKRRMSEAVKVTEHITLQGGQLYFQGDVIAGVLGERMLQMMEEGFDLVPMELFITNLYQNPSKRVVDHLYAFLEKGKSPITPDGHFLAYKAVRDDYLDIHSGSFNNSVGQEVKMPRNRVDEDPDRTCSEGLHVCSFDYLPHFSHADGHVMVCKVNPADVVAIPRDYHDTKMRVCRYEVVDEHEGYYQDKGDVLSAASVASDTDEPFLLEVLDAGGTYVERATYARLADAAEALESLCESEQFRKVRLTNVVTGGVIAEEEIDNFVEEDAPEWNYKLVGVDDEGNRETVDTFDEEADGVMAALDYSGYVQMELVDAAGRVVRTIS